MTAVIIADCVPSARTGPVTVREEAEALGVPDVWRIIAAGSSEVDNGILADSDWRFREGVATS